MNKQRLIVAITVVAAIAAYIYFDLGRYFSLAYLKSQQAELAAYTAAHTAQTIALYVIVYIAVTALSLPGAAILTLAGGALFGLVTGTVIVSFASSIGATLAMLVARFVLRDWVQAKFARQLAPLDAGIAKDGPFYLFALRLVPLFPFFVINLAMGLTKIRPWTFYWVSQLGMLAGTIVFVNLGTQLAKIDSLRGALSPTVLLSFVLLGVFPLAAKSVLAALKARKVYARWPKPAAFDYNLVVIGAGSAGLVSAYIAAATKAKVALIERHQMGGDCLNTGCVPSKALIRSAKLLHQMRGSASLGIAQARAQFDFADVMERVARVVRTVEPHDSVARYTALGVECIHGQATLASPWTVAVQTADGTRELRTKAIVIAAGARPFVPPIPGIDAVGYLTSETLWQLRALPPRIVVLGGGPIGCELAQAFARFGSKVTQVEMAPRLLMREDTDVAAHLLERFVAEGIDVKLSHRAKQFVVETADAPGAVASDAKCKILIAERDGEDVRIEFDALIVAVGRVANTEGYGLDELGIGTSPQRTIDTDAYLQTLYPNIYACGDVAGPYQFTHTAAHQAWYAAVNALFGRFRRFKADYRVIPWATFTDPEVARVGLNEQEAQEQGIAHEVTVYGIDDLDRAIADESADGFVKVLTRPGSDAILGVTIVGSHAGELIAEYVLAMKQNIGLKKILGTIHIYPTLAEANKYAAGNWRRKQVTLGQWALAEAFQRWMRGSGGIGAVLGKLSGAWRDRRPAYADEAGAASSHHA